MNKKSTIKAVGEARKIREQHFESPLVIDLLSNTNKEMTAWIS